MAEREVDPQTRAEDDPAADHEKDTDVGPQPPKPPRAGRRVGGLARELLIVVVGALVLSSLIRAFLGQMFVIPSESMENTLLVKDRVFVQKFDGFDGALFTRGQVVVFADPGQWLSEPPTPRSPVRRALELVGVLPDSATGYLIKRVIGMPGDTVVCCDAQDRITVNGHPLDERAYLYTDPDGTQVDPSEFPFSVVVPVGRIFVMGDHRDDSRDSRCHLSDSTPGEPIGMNAFVPIADVVGPAIAITAPIRRIASLPEPQTFTGVPAAAASAPAAPTIKPAGIAC